MTLRLVQPQSDPALCVRLAGPGLDALAAIVAACCPGVLLTDDAAALALVWWDGTHGLGALAGAVAVCPNPLHRASALDAGAEAALALPLDDALLQSVARRIAGVPPPPPAASVSEIILGPLSLDLDARTLEVTGTDVPLTLKEFDLAAFLLARPGVACTRDDILEAVWGIDWDTGTNTVDVFIYTLRRKLREAGLPGLIRTVRGVGYRLDPPTQP